MEGTMSLYNRPHKLSMYTYQYHERVDAYTASLILRERPSRYQGEIKIEPLAKLHDVVRVNDRVVRRVRTKLV